MPKVRSGDSREPIRGMAPQPDEYNDPFTVVECDIRLGTVWLEAEGSPSDLAQGLLRLIQRILLPAIQGKELMAAFFDGIDRVHPGIPHVSIDLEEDDDDQNARPVIWVTVEEDAREEPIDNEHF